MYIFICYIQERLNNRVFNYFTMYRVKVLYFVTPFEIFLIYFKLKMMTEMPCLLVKQIIKEDT